MSFFAFNENGTIDSLWGNIGNVVLDFNNIDDYIYGAISVEWQKKHLFVALHLWEMMKKKPFLGRILLPQSNSISISTFKNNYSILPNSTNNYFCILVNFTITLC